MQRSPTYGTYAVTCGEEQNGSVPTSILVNINLMNPFAGVFAAGWNYN